MTSSIASAADEGEPSPPPREPSLVVSGTVKQKDGAPVPFARVTLRTKTGIAVTSAAADGSFRSDDLRPTEGKVTVTVKPDQRAIFQGTKTVEITGNTVDVGEVVASPAASLTVVVVGADATPLRYVTVSVNRLSPGNGTLPDIATDNAGRAVFVDLVVPGEYEVKALGDTGIAADPVKIRITADNPTPAVTIDLVPAVDATFTLVDSKDPKQILRFGGNVVLTRAGKAGAKFYADARDGKFSRRLPMGKYRVSSDGLAKAGYYLPASDAIDVSPTSRDLTLAVKPVPTVVFKVTGPDGASVKDAEVLLSGEATSISGKTDASGTVSFSAAPSKYLLRVLHPAFLPMNGNATISDPQDPVTLTLNSGTTVTGVVEDEAGKPVPKAFVLLRNSVPQYPTTTSGNDGRFSLDKVDPKADAVVLVTHSSLAPTSLRVFAADLSKLLKVTLKAGVQLSFELRPHQDAKTATLLIADPKSGALLAQLHPRDGLKQTRLLNPGTYDLAVQGAAGVHRVRQITVTGPADLIVELTPPPQGSPSTYDELWSRTRRD